MNVVVLCEMQSTTQVKFGLLLVDGGTVICKETSPTCIIQMFMFIINLFTGTCGLCHVR
jgi:hypothetical protein